MTNEFTIAIPVKGTAAEKATLPCALRSAALLGPDDLLVATDADGPEWVCQEISRHAPKARVLKVAYDPAWASQLCHVHYEMYLNAETDRVFTFDCDSAVRREILYALDDPAPGPHWAGLVHPGPAGGSFDPLEDLGKNGLALISYLKNLRRGGLVLRMRRQAYMWRVTRSYAPFAGYYWAWRPAYMDIISQDAFKMVGNGVDTYLHRMVCASGRWFHASVALPGTDSFTDLTPDYPWHQYSSGIWMGANRRLPHRVLMTTLLSVYPWYLRGYLWAITHPGSPVARLASRTSRAEWMEGGGSRVRGMRKWPDKVASTTGFGK